MLGALLNFDDVDIFVFLHVMYILEFCILMDFMHGVMW